MASVLVVLSLVASGCNQANGDDGDDRPSAPAAVATDAGTAMSAAPLAATAAPTQAATAEPLVAAAEADPVAREALDAPRLTPLSEPGCCTRPFWAADSQRVMYIDRPAPDAPVGIWSLDAQRPEASPALVTDEIGYYSSDMAYRIELDETTTTLVRREDGERWTVPAAGEPVTFSPDGTRIAWRTDLDGRRFGGRPEQIWIADLSGENARQIATVQDGSLSGWLSDDQLLVSGEEDLPSGEEVDVLWVMQTADGARREIARADRLRGELPSPGGRWVAYYISRDDPSRTGMWLASTDGGAPRRLDKSLFGAYKWRDAGHLIVAPMRVGRPSHQLFEVDAETLTSRTLTDPDTTSFKIANGDWTVSPDGTRVAFVESRDKRIWVLELPRRDRGAVAD